MSLVSVSTCGWYDGGSDSLTTVATAGWFAEQTGVYEYVGSGGLTLAGAAETSYRRVFSYVAAGGIAFAGDAYTGQSSVHTYAGSGGLTFGGSADTGLVPAPAQTPPLPRPPGSGQSVGQWDPRRRSSRAPGRQARPARAQPKQKSQVRSKQAKRSKSRQHETIPAWQDEEEELLALLL